ncbi:predicted methyltransferases [Moorella thermoacetica Y72]|uniref:Predicted methyltransferases n=1 Tax=Moorella thermoacetica Y72 TaxID=1325331 RepID=A0A0S6UH67_NEOTH|nr:predicted methyltransferases [Moorella thermoacetica Y72]
MVNPMFKPQQPLLDCQAAAETYQAAVFTDYPVAGDYNPHRIAADSLSSSPGSPGTADSPGQVAVAASGTIGNFQQGRPDRALEGGAVEIQGQVEGPAAAGEIFIQLDHGFPGQTVLLIGSNSNAGEYFCQVSRGSRGRLSCKGQPAEAGRAGYDCQDAYRGIIMVDGKMQSCHAPCPPRKIDFCPKWLLLAGALLQAGGYSLRAPVVLG